MAKHQTHNPATESQKIRVAVKESCGPVIFGVIRGKCLGAVALSVIATWVIFMFGFNNLKETIQEESAARTRLDTKINSNLSNMSESINENSKAINRLVGALKANGGTSALFSDDIELLSFKDALQGITLYEYPAESRLKIIDIGKGLDENKLAKSVSK